MTTLYHIFLKLYLFAARALSPFSPKAALFYRGRVSLLEKIEGVMAQCKREEQRRYWFHCASAGEFEQARPLIEQIKEREKSSSIIVTFFSPSGYQLHQNYPLATAVFYLPMDSKKNVNRFLEAVDPHIALFVKYEFWRNYLTLLKERGVPLYLISAIFREEQPFFKWWGAHFRELLANFTHLFLQDLRSKELLEGIAIDNCSVVGDTRFDRVLQVVEREGSISSIEQFLLPNGEGTRELCVIAGSSWPKDEELLHTLMEELERRGSPIKLIIAPHQVEKSSIEQLERLFSNFRTVKYSQVERESYSEQESERLQKGEIYILDTVGLLSIAYRYGDFAYVGGGFGVGIHNLLEPAAYGLPPLFGPNYKKFREAVELIELGGGFSIKKGEEQSFFRMVENSNFREEASKRAKGYVEKNRGATANILKQITPLISR